MKKNVIILIRFLFQLFCLFLATETLAQSASKQINEIKRNEAYLFEEATAATAKEARDLAVVKLAKVLADYMQEKNPAGAAKLDNFKDLAEGAEEIVADRGSQKRVFLYFSKSDIDATADEASQAKDHQTKPEQEQKEDAKPEPQPVIEQASSNKVEPDVEPVVEEKNVTKPVTASPASESHPQKSVSDNSLAEWQKKLVSTFLTDGLTLLSAKDLVNTYKIENKVKRFGSKTNPPVQAGQAIYVFADETGKVVAVLGRDEGGQRMNYVSGNYENISDYNSSNYIWFTLNK